MKRFISKEWLEDRHACLGDVKKFTHEWGDGVELTLKNLLRAADLDIDLEWFVEEFFDEQPGDKTGAVGALAEPYYKVEDKEYWETDRDYDELCAIFGYHLTTNNYYNPAIREKNKRLRYGLARCIMEVLDG